jgi:hypothetical protein
MGPRLRRCGAWGFSCRIRHRGAGFLYPTHAPQAYRTTTRRRGQLRQEHAPLSRDKGSIKRDEIAARQAWLLSEHLVRERKLRVIDAREMFLQMKDQA